MIIVKNFRKNSRQRDNGQKICLRRYKEIDEAGYKHYIIFKL
jgi:hypothetical protein